MEPLGVQDRFKTKILKFDTFKFTEPKLQYTIIIEVEYFPRFPSTQVLLGDKIFNFGLVYARPINHEIKNLIGIASSEPVNVKGEIEDIVFLKMSEEEIEEIKRNQKKKRRKNK